MTDYHNTDHASYESHSAAQWQAGVNFGLWATQGHLTLAQAISLQHTPPRSQAFLQGAEAGFEQGYQAQVRAEEFGRHLDSVNRGVSNLARRQALQRNNLGTVL